MEGRETHRKMRARARNIEKAALISSKPFPTFVNNATPKACGSSYTRTGRGWAPHACALAAHALEVRITLLLPVLYSCNRGTLQCRFAP